MSDTRLHGYRLEEGVPTVDRYLALRSRAGLSPKNADQALAALSGSWCAYRVTHLATDEVVAMGRVIGDGGWYFHIVDMAVLPDHQRQGLGDALLAALLQHIADRAPAGAFVNLLADEPGRRLYERHEFTYTAPKSLGMAKILGDAGDSSPTLG